MVEVRLGMPVARQANAMGADMLVDVVRHRMRVCTLEHPAAFAEQGTVHTHIGHTSHTRSLVVVMRPV
ncbi:hypothetical protein D3C84_1071720 [compost metagenome]